MSSVQNPAMQQGLRGPTVAVAKAKALNPMSEPEVDVPAKYGFWGRYQALPELNGSESATDLLAELGLVLFSYCMISAQT